MRYEPKEKIRQLSVERSLRRVVMTTKTPRMRAGVPVFTRRHEKGKARS